MKLSKLKIQKCKSSETVCYKDNKKVLIQITKKSVKKMKILILALSIRIMGFANVFSSKPIKTEIMLQILFKNP
jgi:hypothetical protein